MIKQQTTIIKPSGINLQQKFEEKQNDMYYKNWLKNPTPDIFMKLNIQGNPEIYEISEYIVVMVLYILVYANIKCKADMSLTEISKLDLDFLLRISNKENYVKIANNYIKYLENQKLPKIFIDSLFLAEVKHDTILASIKRIVNLFFLLNLDYYASKYPEYFASVDYIKKLQTLILGQLSTLFYDGRLEYFIVKGHKKLLEQKADKIPGQKDIALGYKDFLQKLFNVKTTTSKLIKTFENLKKIIIQYKQTLKTDKQTKQSAQVKQDNSQAKQKQSKTNTEERLLDKRKRTTVKEKEDIIASLKQLLEEHIKMLKRYGTVDTNLTDIDKLNEYNIDSLYLKFISKNNLVGVYYNVAYKNTHTLLDMYIEEFNIKELAIKVYVNLSNPLLKNYTLGPKGLSGIKKLSWLELLVLLKDIHNISDKKFLFYLEDTGMIQEKQSSIDITTLGVKYNEIEEIINNEEFLEEDEKNGIIDWNKLLASTNNKLIKELKSSYAETFREIEMILNFKLQEGQITEEDKKEVYQEIIEKGVKDKYRHIFFNDELFKNALKDYFDIRKYVNVMGDITTEVSRKIELIGDFARKKKKFVMELQNLLDNLGRFKSIKYRLNVFIRINGKRKKIGEINNYDIKALAMFDISQLIDNIDKYLTNNEEPETVWFSGKINFFLSKGT